ncbi:MAG TPA: NYN domain-containing protein [Thermodesulfobacteriota bacterium]|nr:NYN domain-containing protein [Thermodesulfobacteriota bacterium]
MHLIIDGYNLLHADRTLVSLNPIQLQRERDRLVDQLSAYRSLRQMEITVVFDGWQGGWSTEKRERKKEIELVFSKLGEKADEVIKRLVKEKGAGATVVTSDREISRYAEKMAVAVIPSDQFKEKMENTLMKGQKDLQDQEERGGEKKKGPSRMLSKKEKRMRSALKKL